MKRSVNKTMIEETLKEGGFIRYDEIEDKAVLADIEGKILGSIRLDTFIKSFYTCKKFYASHRYAYYR